MAETTRTRVRRRLRQRRRESGAAQPRPTGWSRSPDFPPPEPDDPAGGAGVREPRRPYPCAPAGTLTLVEPRNQRLDLVG